MIDLERSAAQLRETLEILEHIRKEGGKYVLYSKDGKKRLGEYPSHEAALKRERQVEYFKHQENVTDGSGHEHGGDGKFTGSGGGDSGGGSHAEKIRSLGDSALEKLKSIKDAVKTKSMKAQRKAIWPEAEKQIAAVNKHFDDLESSVKDDKEAEKIATDMGYQAVKGSKSKVLKTLRQKTLDRIGSYIRPYA